jgi:hypothetical protein
MALENPRPIIDPKYEKLTTETAEQYAARNSTYDTELQTDTKKGTLAPQGYDSSTGKRLTVAVNPNAGETQTQYDLRVGNTVAPAAGSSPVVAETESQVVERKRKESQSQIDAVNARYDNEIALETERNKKNNIESAGQSNALAIFSGLGGSEEAKAKKINIDTAYADSLDAKTKEINARRSAETSAIYKQISDDATSEFRWNAERADKKIERDYTIDQDMQKKALENAKLLASTGNVDFASFKENSLGATANEEQKNTYKYLEKTLGGEETMKAFFFMNRPKKQVIGSPIRAGDKYMQQYQNPITGEVVFEDMALPFDLPPEYTDFQKQGDYLLAFPKGWDGDTTKIKKIYSPPGAKESLDLENQRLQNEKLRQENAGIGGYKFSNDDNRILIGSGLSSQMVAAIQNDLQTLGADKVLANKDLTEKERAAIQKVLSGGKNAEEPYTKEQLTSALSFGPDAVSSVDIAAQLKDVYSNDELEQMALDSGASWGRAFGPVTDGDIADYLSSPAARKKYIELIYEQYKADGLAQ